MSMWKMVQPGEDSEAKETAQWKVGGVMSLKENAHTSGNALIISGVQKDIRKRCI